MIDYRTMTAREIRKIGFENCPHRCVTCEEDCGWKTVRDCRNHLIESTEKPNG